MNQKVLEMPLPSNETRSKKEIIRQIVCDATGLNRYEIHVNSGSAAKYARLILLAMLTIHGGMKNRELTLEFSWKMYSSPTKAQKAISRYLKENEDFSRLYTKIEQEIIKTLKLK